MGGSQSNVKCTKQHEHKLDLKSYLRIYFSLVNLTPGSFDLIAWLNCSICKTTQVFIKQNNTNRPDHITLDNCIEIYCNCVKFKGTKGCCYKTGVSLDEVHAHIDCFLVTW